MNSFFSEFKNTRPKKFTITHKQKIALWGSCFAENMLSKFSEMGFSASSNPYGVLFNPMSIATLFKKIDTAEPIQEQEIIKTHMGYTSFLTHSKFSFETSQELRKAFIARGNNAKEAQVFIISLGTAWIYKHNESNLLCASCHKIPQNQFTKILMSISEISESLQQIEETVLNWNKSNRIIYTLSPVRHTKDGFIENQQSKARLHCSIMERLNNQKVSYFPAYEIMMDELREYRFYKEDLVHPNTQAIKHIWKHFKQYYFTENELNVAEDYKKYYQLTHHNILSNSPIEKNSIEQKILQLKTVLKEKYPFLELS